MNTVYILWLRQLKRYFRSKSRIVGSLGQPLLFLVALGFGFGPPSILGILTAFVFMGLTSILFTALGGVAAGAAFALARIIS